MTAKRILESSLWYLALVFIAIHAFTNGGFSDPKWLVLSAFFYGYSAIVLVSMLRGARFNTKALKSARPVLVLLALSLLWLWLPLWVSVEHALYDVIKLKPLSQSLTPPWFDPVTLWSVSPERGRWLWLSEFYLASLFLLIVLLLDSRRRLKQLLIVMIVVGLVHAAIGLAAKFAGVLFVDAQEVDGHFSAARGLFVNRNHFGAFLVLCAVGSLALQFRTLLNSQSRLDLVRQQLSVSNMLVLLTLLVLFSACIASESRGALLALLLAILSGILVMGIQRLRHARWLFIALLVAGIAVAVYFGQGLLNRFLNNSLSFGERPTQWLITLKAIAENPLLGYGGGSYGTVFQVFRETTELRQVFFAQSHNHYLHLWLERGLVGLGLWLAIWVYVLWFIRQNIRQRKSTLVLATLCAVWVGILAALIQSFVDFNLQILNIRAYFMILMAMAIAVPHINHR